MAASALSPSSSPRLPSPPPIAEDQLGPKSPVAATDEQQKLFSNLDHGAARRIRPGTKAEDMAEGPPLVDLTEIDSAFQLTEHLKALHNFLTHPIGANTTLAVDKDMAHKLAQPPDNVDKTLWLYELCRFLTQKVNSIIIALFSDSPPCSATTCPEMRASEWQYLCAVHDPPKSCCAIDYCCHTLDWAANTLTSQKHFPSRLAMGSDQNTQHQQIRQLTNIFRRVYRIFAHAWFQHRDMFWKVEGRSGLYILFKTVCDVYGLIPEDNYTIPSEAEGLETVPQAAPPMILKRESSCPGSEESGNASIIEGVSDHTLSTAGTTKRHRHSPSVGATAVSTVVEEEEEENSVKEEGEVSVLHAEADGEVEGEAQAQADAQGEAEGEEEAEADAPRETTAEVDEGSVSVDEPTVGEDASAEEAVPADAIEATEAPDEAEKQSASASEVEEDATPAHNDKAGSETTQDETVAVETKDADADTEQKSEAEDKLDVEEASSTKPEKAEKDEAAAEPEKAGDVKESEGKPGSDN